MSRIEREYEASDQQRYYVPCPHCGTLQWLKFERLHWPKGLPDRTHYVCEACEEAIEERHEPWMIAEANGADWMPTASAERVATAKAAGIVGFHISGLYSPLGWLSWDEIARGWGASMGYESAHLEYPQAETRVHLGRQ